MADYIDALHKFLKSGEYNRVSLFSRTTLVPPNPQSLHDNNWHIIDGGDCYVLHCGNKNETSGQINQGIPFAVRANKCMNLCGGMSNLDIDAIQFKNFFNASDHFAIDVEKIKNLEYGWAIPSSINIYDIDKIIYHLLQDGYIKKERKDFYLIEHKFNKNPHTNKGELMKFAVIGAMATTGGDAEEAARLLGVTVDFINERF